MTGGVTVDQRRLAAALEKAEAELLAQRNAAGHWEGNLSSSALSTATAITALAIVGRESKGNFAAHIDAGLKWLADHANADGGWGDTTISRSNLSTTTLCWAAFGAADADERFATTVDSAGAWLRNTVGSANVHALARAVVARYGKDRTFSAPILTMCALSGRFGPGRDAWDEVIQLPFELAAFPRRLYAVLRLPVVSYALPALIAVGQAKHHHAPSGNAIIDGLRASLKSRTLEILRSIQPSNGGFLEATPLTSFVTMSLAGSGQAQNPVARKGTEFLLASQRGDGSWPIDTNLATWVTTLSVNALPMLDSKTRPRVRDWLLNQQYTREHLYTGAAPGAWAWTDLPGGVPDADDTAGAALALSRLDANHPDVRGAAFSGLQWLINLQNADGGLPTFCRGWGALPFDRSSADITAHGIQAWLAWLAAAPTPLQTRLQNAIRSALQFLSHRQLPTGAWSPLWFGNEHAPEEQNFTYGTARVLASLASLAAAERSAWFEPYFERLLQQTLSRGAMWLMNAQQKTGAWSGAESGPVSIEESALALTALARALPHLHEQRSSVAAAISRGSDWLISRVESGEWKQPSPIGFYFARLWYYERLYPIIFTVGALAAVSRLNQTISTGHFGIASRNA
jgi:squalene-hopene/tetraprenyl-beta-curcumene cyclase